MTFGDGLQLLRAMNKLIWSVELNGNRHAKFGKYVLLRLKMKMQGLGF